VPALAALATAAFAAEPTAVYVGPKPSSAAPTEYLTVAFDPSNDGDGVESEQVISELGNRWVDERGDVTCTLTAWTGGTDSAALVARVDHLLDLLDAALAANPSLGVLVPGAEDGSFARVLGRLTLRQESTASGAIVRQTFTVHYSTLMTG